MNAKRLEPDERKNAILNAAVILSMGGHYQMITRDEIARAAGVSAGLVTRYFYAMPELRKQIMREAVRREIPEIIAQGIATRCPIALAAPGPLKLRAAILVAG